MVLLSGYAAGAEVVGVHPCSVTVALAVARVSHRNLFSRILTPMINQLLPNRRVDALWRLPLLPNLLPLVQLLGISSCSLLVKCSTDSFRQARLPVELLLKESTNKINKNIIIKLF